MGTTLRPHQREALADVVPALMRHDPASGAGLRATAVMACGTGKTLLGAAVGQQVVPGAPALVAVPTIELLGQTAAAWSAYDPRRRFTAVCSDAEVLSSHGLDSRSVTTNPVEIAQVSGASTVVCTYSSLPVIAEAHRLHRLPPWELAIADEAHRTAGAMDKSWGRIHENGIIPAARRLNLTATPRFFDTDTGAAVSMDDTAIFGPVAYRLSFGEAIKRKLLNDYRVVVPIVSDADMVPLLEQAKRYLAAGEMVDAQALALAVAVIKATDNHRMHKAISYHSVISDAVEFSRAMRLAAQLLGTEGHPRDVSAAYVHGEQSPRARQLALAALRESGHDLELLANVKILAEGVDIPAVDGVVFAYAKTSMVDIIQAVGRAMRLHDDNDMATIVIPVFVPEGLTAESAVADSRYAGLWRVLQALRAVDDRLEHPDLLRAALTGSRGEEDGAERSPRVYIEAPRVPDGFARAIEVRTLNFDAQPRWLIGALHARRHFQEHGDLNVPSNYRTADGFALGDWLGTQRSNKQLSAGRVAYLDSLGMVWDRYGLQWQESLGHLRAYVAQHGHANVPYTYTSPGGFALGRWLREAVGRHRRGENVLSPERLNALEALGVDFGPIPLRQEQRALEAAAEYHRAHGDLKPDPGYVTGSGFPLGNWLKTQRHAYRHGNLNAERTAALDRLGIDWGITTVQRHDTALAAAAAYAREHGDLRVPSGHITPAGFPLGAWITERRKDHKLGRLNPELLEALNRLGMVWSPTTQAWEQNIAAARRFHAAHGHLRVPPGYTDPGTGNRLGLWIKNQRQNHAKGRLAADRVAALEALGMAWDAFAAAWEEKAEALKGFAAENGHTDVPQKFIDAGGTALGYWLRNQRQDFLTGKLRPERLAELRKIGVPW